MRIPIRLSAPRKYGNRKTVVDNITFDSAKEAKRYQELKILERAGEISDLKLQQTVVLIPEQRGERKATWRADFMYTDNRTKEEVWEDAKGKRTPLYTLKRKLVLFIHGKTIRET